MPAETVARGHDAAGSPASIPETDIPKQKKGNCELETSSTQQNTGRNSLLSRSSATTVGGASSSSGGAAASSSSSSTASKFHQHRHVVANNNINNNNMYSKKYHTDTESSTLLQESQVVCSKSHKSHRSSSATSTGTTSEIESNNIIQEYKKENDGDRSSSSASSSEDIDVMPYGAVILSTERGTTTGKKRVKEQQQERDPSNSSSSSSKSKSDSTSFAAVEDELNDPLGRTTLFNKNRIYRQERSVSVKRAKETSSSQTIIMASSKDTVVSEVSDSAASSFFGAGEKTNTLAEISTTTNKEPLVETDSNNLQLPSNLLDCQSPCSDDERTLLLQPESISLNTPSIPAGFFFPGEQGEQQQQAFSGLQKNRAGAQKIVSKGSISDNNSHTMTMTMTSVDSLAERSFFDLPHEHEYPVHQRKKRQFFPNINLDLRNCLGRRRNSSSIMVGGSNGALPIDSNGYGFDNANGAEVDWEGVQQILILVFVTLCTVFLCVFMLSDTLLASSSNQVSGMIGTTTGNKQHGSSLKNAEGDNNKSTSVSASTSSSTYFPGLYADDNNADKDPEHRAAARLGRRNGQEEDNNGPKKKIEREAAPKTQKGGETQHSSAKDLAKVARGNRQEPSTGAKDVPKAPSSAKKCEASSSAVKTSVEAEARENIVQHGSTQQLKEATKATIATESADALFGNSWASIVGKAGATLAHIHNNNNKQQKTSSSKFSSSDKETRATQATPFLKDATPIIRQMPADHPQVAAERALEEKEKAGTTSSGVNVVNSSSGAESSSSRRSGGTSGREKKQKIFESSLSPTNMDIEGALLRKVMGGEEEALHGSVNHLTNVEDNFLQEDGLAGILDSAVKKDVQKSTKAT